MLPFGVSRYSGVLGAMVGLCDDFHGEGYEAADRLPPDLSKMKRLGWASTVGLWDTLREAMESYLLS